MKVSSLFVSAIAFVFLSSTGNGSCSTFAGPRITTVSGDELVVPSLHNLTLDCESTEPVNWTLPWLSHHFEARSRDYSERVKISSFQLSEARNGYGYQSRLELASANYLDTGYFSCYHLNVTDNDSITATKIYVYVEDKEKLMVIPEKEDHVTVFAHESSREVIPCKPTSPSVQMALIHFEAGEVANSTAASGNGHPNSWKYDPREGFITEESHEDMNEDYTCVAKLGDGQPQELPVTFYVIPATKSAPKPHIDSTRATYVEINQSFQLNCSAVIEPVVAIELTWTLPSGNLTSSNKRIKLGKLSADYTNVGETLLTLKVVHLVLYVTNVTKQDEGNYSCTAIDHSGLSGKATTYVKVHDEGVSYVNISNAGVVFEVDTELNNTFSWVVNYAAHPWPEIVWFKTDDHGDDDEVIKFKASNALVQNEVETTTLKIVNITAADSGYYKLLIKTSKVQDSRTFLLKVKDKPRALVYPRSKFVRKNEDFEFICDINSYPPADVRLLFRPCAPSMDSPFELKECKDKWSLLYSSSNPLTSNRKNEEKVSLITRDYKSQTVYVAGRAQMGGEYSCNACNSYGCAKTSPRSLTTIEINELEHNASEIEVRLSSSEPLIAGEHFNVSCTVSLYKFMPKFTWSKILLNGSVQAIDETSLISGLSFDSMKTKYSYTEMLIWDKIPQSAEANYSCRAVDISNQTAMRVISLSVKQARSTNEVPLSSGAQLGCVMGSFILIFLLALFVYKINKLWKQRESCTAHHPLETIDSSKETSPSPETCTDKRDDDVHGVTEQAGLL